MNPVEEYPFESPLDEIVFSYFMWRLLFRIAEILMRRKGELALLDNANITYSNE